MAILHIMGVNHTHPDPIKDERGCYKIGDILSVKEDTAHDGDLVRNPIAPGRYLIKVLGKTRTQMEKYVESKVDKTDPEKPITIRRRLHHFDLANLPSAIMGKLQSDRYVEVTENQIKDYLKNKDTGKSE